MPGNTVLDARYVKQLEEKLVACLKVNKKYEARVLTLQRMINYLRTEKASLVKNETKARRDRDKWLGRAAAEVDRLNNENMRLNAIIGELSKGGMLREIKS